jgi:hypothetical protein
MPEFAKAIYEITAVYTGIRYGEQDASKLEDLKHMVREFPDKR